MFRRSFQLYAILTIMLILLNVGVVLSQAEPVNLIIFRDVDSLTLYIPGNQPVSLQGLTLEVETATGARISHLLEEFPSFRGLPFNRVPTPICLRLEREGISRTPPIECQNILTLFQIIPAVDIFWYDDATNQGRLVLLLRAQSDERSTFCPPQDSRCEMTYIPPATIPTAIVAPTDTPVPTSMPTPIPIDCTPDTYEISDIRVPAFDPGGLINAINVANADPDFTVICLTESDYRLAQADGEHGDAPTGLPAITSEIVIYGNHATIRRDSDASFRIMFVGGRGILTLENVNIENGRLEGVARGAGVFVRSGELTVRDSTFSNNHNVGDQDPETTDHFGGAIAQSGGIMAIINSTFTSNSARAGGAISIRARGENVSTVIRDSTFERNQAVSQIEGDNLVGGAILIYEVQPTGTIDIIGGSFSRNEAQRGAAIYIAGDRGRNSPNVTIDAASFDQNILGASVDQNALPGGSVIWSQMNNPANRLNIGNLFINDGNSRPNCHYNEDTNRSYLPNSRISGGDGTC